jgi:hypothetical protein
MPGLGRCGAQGGARATCRCRPMPRGAGCTEGPASARGLTPGGVADHKRWLTAGGVTLAHELNAFAAVLPS